MTHLFTTALRPLAGLTLGVIAYAAGFYPLLEAFGRIAI